MDGVKYYIPAAADKGIGETKLRYKETLIEGRSTVP